MDLCGLLTYQRLSGASGFSNGHTLLQQLISLNQEAIAAFAETQEKISDCPNLAPPLPLEQIEAMEQ